MKCFASILLLIICLPRSAQLQMSVDSLKNLLHKTNNDTLRLTLNGHIGEIYLESQADSSLLYIGQELALARKLDYRLNEAYAIGKIGYVLMNSGEYPQALQKLLTAIEIVENPSSAKNVLSAEYLYGEDAYSANETPDEKRKDVLARLHQYVGILYGNATNYEKEKSHHLISRELASQTRNLMVLSLTNGTLGRSYLYLKKLDSALIYLHEAYDQSLKIGYLKYRGSVLFNLGRVYVATGDNAKAKEFFYKALDASEEYQYMRGVVASQLALADILNKEGKRDSILALVESARDISNSLNVPGLQVRSYTSLAGYYRKAGLSDSVVLYQDKIIRINDSIFNSKQAQLFQNIDFDEQQRQQQLELAEKQREDRLRMYVLLAGLTILICVAIILWRNNHNKQKAYTLLEKQKQETDHQRQKAEQALGELKSAQAQLIHSEKMASLGELTAGIAHEIENPLNFINNFAALNKELLDELKTELKSGNPQERQQLFSDIQSNLDKVILHGQKADAIVKSMMQHTSNRGSEKELSDAAALTEEFSRLAYHGYRSKHHSFFANMEYDFDPQASKVRLFPQDFGRVVVNLLNNSFYAMNKRSDAEGPVYVPELKISTKHCGNAVEIRIKDNGVGIPAAMMDKIFQPFFTTKPPGEGTGLGLSISYEIITRGHGGLLRCISKEGEGSEFIIRIPY